MMGSIKRGSVLLLFGLLMMFSGCGDTSPVDGNILEEESDDAVEIIVSAEELLERQIIENEILDNGAFVSIAKSKQFEAVNITQDEIEMLIDEVLAFSGEFEALIENGQTVVIKPNLVQMRVDSTGELLEQTVNGVTTDWRVTNAVVKNVRRLNPDGKIYIMEGSATGPTSEIMEYYHYTSEYMPDVDRFISLEEDCGDWQDFDAPEITKVSLENGLLHDEYYFNRILYEADVLISIPCLKTSSGVVVTAGIKNVSLGMPPGNIYGVSPDNPGKTSMVSHRIVDGELDKWIYDYYMCKPIDFVIVDGLQGFQSGPVPMSHERKETDKMNMGIVLAGRDAVAVDTVCSLITGWDPETVGYLNHFNDNQVGRGDVSRLFIKGPFADEQRKRFTLYRPELGGEQILSDEGPGLEIEDYQFAGDDILIRCDAGSGTKKIEVYKNGWLCGFFSWNDEMESFIIPQDIFEEDTAEIVVIAYDRFLNKTAKALEIRIK